MISAGRGLQIGGQLEKLALLRAFDRPTPNAAHAHAQVLDRAPLIDLDILQIGPERAPAYAGHLAANAAKVFGFALAGVLVTLNRPLTANCTLHTHDWTHFLPSAESVKYSGTQVFDKAWSATAYLTRA
jgi:hypothetical protein